MEKLVIEFKGHIEIDKEDVVIQEIKDGHMVKVNVEGLTPQDIIDGVNKGEYYICLEACMKYALDGETTFEIDEE